MYCLQTYTHACASTTIVNFELCTNNEKMKMKGVAANDRERSNEITDRVAWGMTAPLSVKGILYMMGSR